MVNQIRTKLGPRRDVFRGACLHPICVHAALAMLCAALKAN